MRTGIRMHKGVFSMRKLKEVNEMNHSDPTANRAIGSVNQEWEEKLTDTEQMPQ